MTNSNNRIKELETQLNNLKGALDNIGAYVYTKDLDGRYTFANEMVCNLFQCSIDEIIGHTDEDFFDLERSKELKASDKIVLEKGQKIENIETNYIINTNETRSYWSVKTPLYDKKGNIAGLCGISTDITEKLKTEKELQKTKVLLENILEDAPAGIFVKDKDLNFSYVNSKFANALGFNETEIIGKNNADLFPTDIANQLTKIDLDVTTTGKRFEGESDVINNLGDTRYFWTVLVPLITNNNIEGLLGISYNMSDIISLKKQLENQNKELKDVLEQRNFFMDMVVHELRIPIGFIKMTSEILERGVSEKYKEMVKLIYDTSSDMIELVNSLLDISQLEAGKLILYKSDVSYQSLIEEVIQKNQYIANEKGIKIEQIIEIPQLSVNIDKTKIGRVLNNLLNNAIKYSYRNSEIMIRVFAENNTIITQVIDQGQGIRQKDINEIFQYFKKSNAIPINHEISYGLGLGIAKKLIEEHNGSISVKSKLKKGSTFTFSLPLS